MESLVKQRLVEFIRSKGLTKQRFERIVGLSNGYVSNINNSISHKKLEEISKYFPDLNPSWLIIGEGPMLLSPKGAKAIVDVKATPTPPPAIVPIPGINTHTRTNKKEDPAETDELLRQIVKQNTLLLNQYSQLQSQMQQTLTLLARVLSNSTNPHNPINYKAAEAEDE
jgi:transcriptional regulator with XRE-family HTH domain